MIGAALESYRCWAGQTEWSAYPLHTATRTTAVNGTAYPKPSMHAARMVP